MRAAIVSSYQGPSAVSVREVPEPRPEDDEVLVDVCYAGVVFPDVLHTRGEYQHRPSLPFSPGWEVSGVLRQDCEGMRAGDRVAAMPLVGGFAEVVAVKRHMVFPLPDRLDFLTAAALPLNYLTAHLALVRRGGLREGETVLVHGAAGGVGTAVCNLASALGARVIGVVSTSAKGDVALRAGASDVVLADGFLDRVRHMTAGKGVNMVVDPVGGERFTDSLRSLAPEGRLLVLGFASRDIPTVRTNRLLMTNTSVMGVATNELWSLDPAYARTQWTEVMSLLDDDRLAPVIGGQHPLTETAAALAALDERRVTGKLVIQVR